MRILTYILPQDLPTCPVTIPNDNENIFFHWLRAVRSSSLYFQDRRPWFPFLYGAVPLHDYLYFRL
jgi:hypothetical protein